MGGRLRLSDIDWQSTCDHSPTPPAGCPAVPVDYAALAKEAGAISSTGPQLPVRTDPDVWLLQKDVAELKERLSKLERAGK